MRDVTIAYYAHHQGSGHIRRALEIGRTLHRPMTLFSSAIVPAHTIPHLTSLLLPPDYDEGTGVDQCAVSGLHYAPVGSFDILSRMHMMSAWFRAHWPCLLVVDVSVEVALFARLCGVPTIYIRQNGARSDLPHQLAYESAECLLAPVPALPGAYDDDAKWAKKTVCTGFIARRPQYRNPVETVAMSVVVLVGHGGTELTAAMICRAAAATPDWSWTVLGPLDATGIVSLPGNVDFKGVVDDPYPWLESAAVVVGTAGDNVVAEMAVLQSRYIAVPAARPFDEQIFTARALASLGVAVFSESWPEPGDWAGLLHRALALDVSRWSSLSGDGGAKAAAEVITSVADGFFNTGAVKRSSWLVS